MSLNNHPVVMAGVVVAATVYHYTNGTPFIRGAPTLYADQPLTDNVEWSQYAYTDATTQGYHPELARRSLRKFNNGDYLDGEEYAFMKSAISRNGNPNVQPPTPTNAPLKGVQTNTGPQPVNSYTEN